MLSSLYRAAERKHVPVGCNIELLAPCNLACVHCYVTHSVKSALTLGVLERLFTDLAEAGSFSVTLTGGEIGLRRDLFEIIAAARRRYLQVRLLSSGTRWGPDEWHRLADLGVSSVRMSLYSSRAEVHDAVTQTPGSFERTVATALGLKERGVAVAFACPVMQLNVDDVGDLFSFADHLGVGLVIDPVISVTDNGGTAPTRTRASYDALRRMYADSRVRGRLQSIDPCEPASDTRRPCAVGQYAAFVRSTGDLYPCSRWATAAGNIVRERFIDLWRNSPVFRQARSLTLGDLTGCSSCSNRAHCHPCAAMNVQDNGSLERPAEAVCRTTAARVDAARTALDKRYKQPQGVALPIID